MAITDPNTVLILGAGVSVPFGLPTGANLIDDISQKLSFQLEDFQRRNEAYFSINPILPLNENKTFQKFSYIQPLLWKNDFVSSALKFTEDRAEITKRILEEIRNLKNLQKLLKNQTSDSIDDFIVINPGAKDYVKICIAADFIEALHILAGSYHELELRDIAKRYVSLPGSDGDSSAAERNWIHRLINLIRLGVTDGKVTRDNKVQIITFNYDTILEYVLEQQFANTESGTELYPDYRDFVEITHVHGRCGYLSEPMSVPGKTCWDWARGIRVIREPDGSSNTEIEAQRNRARSIVATATEIYCCGFAFAKANTDLLGLTPKSGASSRTIHYCNYADDIGLHNAASKFERKIDRRAGTTVVPYSRLGASDWIGTGVLGELP